MPLTHSCSNYKRTLTVDPSQKGGGASIANAQKISNTRLTSVVAVARFTGCQTHFQPVLQQPGPGGAGLKPIRRSPSFPPCPESQTGKYRDAMGTSRKPGVTLCWHGGGEEEVEGERV